MKVTYSTYISQLDAPRVSSYIKLPKSFQQKKAIINMKNEDDNDCLHWCIKKALNPVDKNTERFNLESNVRISWDGMESNSPRSWLR